MTTPYRSLQRVEAEARADLLTIESYDVRLDLTKDETTFESVTTIHFDSLGGPTFVDLKPDHVHRVRLNGQGIDPDLLDRGRLPLETASGPNELVVEATMRFRHDGEGLHAHVDPADGRRYVYGMSFMDAAPSIFACFDQPDLKAPYTFSVRTPADWTVVGNAPARRLDVGVWEIGPTQPLSTYFVTIVAGPYHLVCDEHDGIVLGLSARRSLAAALEADAAELFTLTRQSFDEMHRLFGIRYPFGDYHQAFVPEFNAGAMENPGCVTFRDQLVFDTRVTRGMRIARATTVAHEMAHQWFGNIVTPRWWDDLWLNESFAEYLGNRVTAEVTEYADAWVDGSFVRRQWGLVADQGPGTHPVAGNGAIDATAALQDFDGISYAKGSSILRQLAARLGDEVFFGGVVDHLTRNRFGNATMHDLLASWERAGAGDLSGFTEQWLRTAGADTITLDRDAGVLRRTPPASHPAERTHTFRTALAGPDGWRVENVVVDGPETPFDAGDAPVLLDPYDDTWAVLHPDPVTLAALPRLVADVDDVGLLAGIWNNLRSAVHDAAVDPAAVVEVAVARFPVEDPEDAYRAFPRRTIPWLFQTLLPLAPAGAAERLHEAALERLATTAPGSEQQLAALRASIRSAADPSLLRGWLERTPEGIDLDLDLRWRVMVRLATLGATDVAELDASLAAEPTAHATVEHTRARASLPDPAAKAWAWARFTGEARASNYQLEAAGLGLWQRGQEELTAPYVDRYFDELPATAQVRSGWLLAEAADAFFPATSLDRATVDRARALLTDPGLDASLRRRLGDATDRLERMVRVREAWPPS